MVLARLAHSHTDAVDDWRSLGDWWLEEIDTDQAYDQVITPMLLDTLRPQAGHTYLDLGCGEGRVMRAIEETGATAIGVDINVRLAARAGRAVVSELPAIPFSDDSFDGAYSVAVIEHVGDHRAFFREAARVTRPGGVLVNVANHPYWTAPGATPIEDDDGEDLWRPGSYLERGHSDIPIRDFTIRFHHRSMSDILNAAADAGWSLEQMTEHAHHDHTSAADVPRLLACRWRLL